MGSSLEYARYIERVLPRSCPFPIKRSESSSSTLQPDPIGKKTVIGPARQRTEDGCPRASARHARLGPTWPSAPWHSRGRAYSSRVKSGTKARWFSFGLELLRATELLRFLGIPFEWVRQRHKQGNFWIGCCGLGAWFPASNRKKKFTCKLEDLTRNKDLVQNILPTIFSPISWKFLR
jgi:hypothetical protein